MKKSSKRRAAILTGAAAVVVLTAAGCSSNASSDASSDATPSATPTAASSSAAPTESAAGKASAQPAAATAGSYITWDEYQKDKAKYENNNVVLFFNASWCPTCQATVESLDASKGNFPEGLTVVSVDYDSSSELKKQYGVTTQHTFVEIKPNGDQVQKWTGSMTTEAIQAKV